jgi:hypothetical protein
MPSPHLPSHLYVILIMFLLEVMCLILVAGLHSLYTTEAAPIPTGPISSLSALAAGVIEVGLIAKALIIKGKYIMLTYLLGLLGE